jgi:hypothetical protein
MRASTRLQHESWNARKRAQNKTSWMSLDAWGVEVGNVSVLDDSGVLHFISDRAQATAKHHDHLRAQRAA